MQASVRHTEFRATTASARAGFGVLAMVITCALLASVGHEADRQYDAALMAQAGAVHLAASQPAGTRG